MAFERRVTRFLVGSGATMLAALVAARWRSRRRESSNESSPRSELAIWHKWLRRLQSLSSDPPCSSPLRPAHWARSPSSQMGSLGLPGRRQPQRLGHRTVDGKLVIVMVGLPARGKSYIVKMLVRYLSWIGYPTRAFNVGSYRRKLGYAGMDKSFFEGNNEQGLRLREKIVQRVQDDMYKWLHEDEIPKVALLDATNTTKTRREMLLERSKQEENTTIVFVESICDDLQVLAQNYKLKLSNDDYKHQDSQAALQNFEERVRAYEAVYETIEDTEDGGDIQFIKLHNVGQKMVTRNCKGYLPSQVSFYLQNMHISPRKIWLTRHAERVIPDDPSKDHYMEELTEAGRRYSMTLSRYMKLEQESSKVKGAGQEILVLAGTRKVDCETVAHLQMVYRVLRTPLLNDEVEDSYSGLDHPDWQPNSRNEPSFPGGGGESYEDVIRRIRPLIVEVERQRRSLVVVCHGAVHRCLYAYFMGIEVSEVPSLDLPQHQLTELTPSPFGTGYRYISESAMMQHF